MKRSSHLRLALMATLPAALVGCDNPAITGEPVVSQDWQAVDCSTAELMRTDACRAELEHRLAASPRYGSQAECEDALGGACTRIDENGGAWVGPLTGFMTGYLLAEVIDEIGDAYKRRAGYRDYRGYRGGSYPSTRGGYPTSQPDAAPPPARAITQSRSGFGSTSSARSSFGG